MKNESSTPRTDAEVATDEIIAERNYLPSGWVPADFARQLERELAQAQAANARLREAIDSAMNVYLSEPDAYADHTQIAHDMFAFLERAARAKEGGR